MKDIVIRRVSNYGTSHPVFARLRVQSDELLQWANLPKDKQDDVLGIHIGLTNRLLKCHEGYARLIAAGSATLKAGLLTSLSLPKASALSNRVAE